MTGLNNGETYTVSMVAIGPDIPSETVTLRNIALGKLFRNLTQYCDTHSRPLKMALKTLVLAPLLHTFHICVCVKVIYTM